MAEGLTDGRFEIRIPGGDRVEAVETVLAGFTPEEGATSWTTRREETAGGEVRVYTFDCSDSFSKAPGLKKSVKGMGARISWFAVGGELVP